MVKKIVHVSISTVTVQIWVLFIYDLTGIRQLFILHKYVVDTLVNEEIFLNSSVHSF